MITLTYNMEIVNSILQHPDVWPEIAPQGVMPFDLCYLPGLLHFLVNDGDGVISFTDFRDGIKIHPTILPLKRGKLAYEAVEEAIQLVFTSGCSCVYAEIDPNLKHVALFARQLGFKLIESNDRDLFVRRKLNG